MKTKTAFIMFTAAAASLCLAQSPGHPEDSGLFPTTGTFYVNTNYPSNGSTESQGVAIAANGNVLLGWEDDGSALNDYEAAWTLFDGNGNMLTPVTVQTNRSDLDPPNLAFLSVTNTWLSFFRADGSPTPAYTAWGPKIKANLFGNGLGMGATAFALGLEVAELGDINLDAGGGGDFAAVQMLNNDGSPVNILTGGTDANYEPAGDVRIADWDFLSNGNIVIVNESGRQAADRPPEQTSGEVPIYRVVTPAGVEVKAYSLVSSMAASNNSAMWHGAGVTSNGFALRFRWQSRTTVRLFDNAGNPTSANIDLATLTGIPATSGGDRGDGVGFHGNGKDAYVYLCSGAGGPWLTVLNADGTLRYARSVADAGDDIVANRVDAAIAPDGRVLAVWDSALPNADGITVNRLVQGRLFDPAGNPVSSKFVVSEWEHPSNTNILYNSYIPRVAWRGNKVAITWQSENAPTVLSDPFVPPAYPVLAARLFTVPGPAAPAQPTLTISRSGGNVIITWDGGGTLQSADSVTGTWNDLPGINSGNPIPVTGNSKYFRVRLQ